MQLRWLLSAAVAGAVWTAAASAHAQWRGGGDPPPAAEMEDDTRPPDAKELARWRGGSEAPPKEAWQKGARRSVPILGVGVALVSVAAAAAIVGGFVQSDTGGNNAGLRVALGSGALASLALPLIPFGAQRVGYPHRASGLMYTGMALTFLGGALGAASFATWAADPEAVTGYTPVLALASAGTLALGIPFWAGGSRRPKDLPLEAPAPERPHASDALVAAGAAGLTIGVAGVLMGTGLVFGGGRSFASCRVEFGCFEEPDRGGERVGEPMMIAGTMLAGAGLVMLAFGAPSDSEPSIAAGLHRGRLGLHGSF